MPNRPRWAIYFDEKMDRQMLRRRKEIAKETGVDFRKVTYRDVVSRLLDDSDDKSTDQGSKHSRASAMMDRLNEISDGIDEQNKLDKEMKDELKSLVNAVIELTSIVKELK